jgi:hypothetical protein
MSEQNISEKDRLLEDYRRQGKIHGLTGTTPDEAFQKLISEDPEKQRAFLEGSQQGRELKNQEEK